MVFKRKSDIFFCPKKFIKAAHLHIKIGPLVHIQVIVSCLDTFFREWAKDKASQCDSEETIMRQIFWLPWI